MLRKHIISTPLVGLYLLAGPPLHAALLLAPMILTGQARAALTDPRVAVFLILATAFYLADLPTLSHAHFSALSPASSDDRRARREGAAAALLMLVTFWTALLTRSAEPTRWPVGPGVTLLMLGVATRAAAVWTLGRAFITEARPEGTTLVISGVYRWVRHPSETGNLAFVMGTCVLLESRLALVLAALGVVPLTLWRIGREERALMEAHGKRFHRYAGRVKRLIPWVC